MIDFNIVNVMGWSLFPIISGIIAWFTRQTLTKLSNIQDKVSQAVTQAQVEDALDDLQKQTQKDISESHDSLQKQLDDSKNQINILLETILRKPQ